MEFNPFDAANKELFWADPEGGLRAFGHEPTGPVVAVDSDVTTMTAAVDKVVRVEGPTPYLVVVEFQSGHVTELARTLWFRRVALDYRHDLPVLTLLVLLRKQADSPGLTGSYRRHLPDGFLTSGIIIGWSACGRSRLNGS